MKAATPLEDHRPRVPNLTCLGEMRMADEKGAPRARSRVRCEQLLDAASRCFRRDGFHGASIAEISKEAGMSAGHIYHFFANKEAIIAAIVNRQVEHWINLIAQFEQADDVFAAMSERVATGVDERMAEEYVGLWLEILAEGARNPRVGAVLREADARVRAILTHVIDVALEARGPRPPAVDAATTEVVLAMFEGITNRAVLNPGFDRREAARALETALGAVLAM